MLKKEYAGRSVLVTGGAGFIGSHIAEKLVSLGASVIVLDNFSTGFLKNLEAVQHAITVVEGDIQDVDLVKRSVMNVDYIFHCAALVSVYQSTQNPALSHAINYQGTKNIIDALVPERKQRLVFSSTAAVYGNQEGVCYENTMTQPLSPYAHDKLLGEALVEKAVMNRQLAKGVVLRYFNVYGDRQNPEGDYASVIPRFKKAIQNSEPITFFGDGYQTRDFISVHEVVEANLITAIMGLEGFQLCNVATGKSVSLRSVVQDLEHACNQKVVEIIFKPARPGDVRHSQASAQKWHHIKKTFYESVEHDMITGIKKKEVISQKDV